MKTQYFKVNLNFLPFCIVIIGAFLLLTGLTCKKDNIKGLPPATTSGENTMGYLLNGKPWRNHSDDFKISSTKATWDNESLYVSGVNTSVSRLSFFINQPKVGVIPVADYKFFYTSYSSNERFEIDTGSENHFEITRYDNQIISGKFSLTFKSPSGDTVKITSGRFDMKIFP